MDNKLYIDANTLLKDSFTLAQQMYDNNETPSCILSVWRGGGFPGKIIHEYFKYKKHDIESYILTTKSYTNINKQGNISIDISTNTLHNLQKCSNILLVDDIFDTGRTIDYIIKYLANYNITSIKIATIFYKPTKNVTNIVIFQNICTKIPFFQNL